MRQARSNLCCAKPLRICLTAATIKPNGDQRRVHALDRFTSSAGRRLIQAHKDGPRHAERSGQWFAFALSGWTTTWPTQLLAIIWILWVISWVVASFWSGQTKKHVMTCGLAQVPASHSRRRRSLHAIGRQGIGEKPLWQFGSVGVYVLACLVLAGISFTWWARIISDVSGRTRSRTRKAIRSSTPALWDGAPSDLYGLIAGMLVTGIAVGTVTAMLGAALISLDGVEGAHGGGLPHGRTWCGCLWTYCRRVPMLIPFLRPT